MDEMSSFWYATVHYNIAVLVGRIELTIMMQSFAYILYVACQA